MSAGRLWTGLFQIFYYHPIFCVQLAVFGLYPSWTSAMLAFLSLVMGVVWFSGAWARQSLLKLSALRQFLGQVEGCKIEQTSLHDFLDYRGPDSAISLLGADDDPVDRFTNRP